MKTFFWIFPLLGSLIAGVVVFFTATLAKGAPQEAAGYAMACAFAVVPYVLARSVAAMIDDDASIQLKRLVRLLEQQQGKSRQDT